MANIEAYTTGNATLTIKKEDTTLLVTDPWFDEHDCYFGSWRLSHEIPNQMKQDALRAKYVFISHFHPDHLNLKTLRLFKNNSKIIVGEQFSERVPDELRNIGFDVIILPTRKWINIDKQCKILMFTDEKQDTSLLVEINHGLNKTLLLNLNDSGGCGCVNEIQSISKKYKNSILLQLNSYGDADMINLWDLDSNLKIKTPCDDFSPIGALYNKSMNTFNCNIAIPFSSSHQYQRIDSWWLRKYNSERYEDHLNGFVNSKNRKLLAPYQKIIFSNSQQAPIFENINPKKLVIEKPVDCKVFGDNWEDGMKQKDKKEIDDYFQSIYYLKKTYDKISVRFNKDIYSSFLNSKSKYKREILFHCPRRSFMYAIRNNIFDDLLIGNFMKTYLKGIYNLSSPRFNVYVTKLADNAYARTKLELEEAFAYYNQDRELSDKFRLKFISFLSIIKDQMLSTSLRSKLRKIYYKIKSK